MKRARQGDKRAFEDLIKDNETKIYNISYRLLRKREDAADIVQETFIQAFRKLNSFRGKSSFSTWLYRIATNLCFQRLRSKKKRTISLDEPVWTDEGKAKREIPDWSNDPRASLENKELRQMIDRGISELPSKYRAAFILRDMEGLPISKISEILKLSEPAVKSRLHRSRLFLREKLSDCFEKRK